MNGEDYALNKIKAGNLIIGESHTLSGAFSSIAGGCGNEIANTTDTANFIGGGCQNCVDTGLMNFIGGGRCNEIVGLSTSNTHRNVIVGGYNSCMGLGGTCNVCLSFIGGGQDHRMCGGGYNTMVGGYGHHIHGTNTACNFIGGGSGNKICDSTVLGTIAGGNINQLSTNSDYSTIGGGRNNTISACQGTIGGGCLNSVAGACATVGGGYHNDADGTWATVAGGYNNSADGSCSFVGGGRDNVVNNNSAGILGGCSNTVNHDKSFIVGSNITSLGACTTFVNNISHYAQSGTTSYLSSGDAAGEIVYFGVAVGSLTAGEVYYLSTTSDGTWVQADADSSLSSKSMLAIALGTSVADGMLIRGFIRNSAYTFTDEGSPIYLSTTAGDMTQTQPYDIGDIVRVVGYLVSSAQDTIYFTPDNTWIQIEAAP
jgi:hypothetical protein